MTVYVNIQIIFINGQKTNYNKFWSEVFFFILISSICNSGGGKCVSRESLWRSGSEWQWRAVVAVAATALTKVNDDYYEDDDGNDDDDDDDNNNLVR